MWSDERDLIMNLFNDNGEAYPKTCPCCGKKDGHIFMYKFDDAAVYGSAWVWCSACQEYSHSRYLIPDWWKNYDGVEADELHNRPDNLDLIKNEIDQWVNSLR